MVIKSVDRVQITTSFSIYYNHNYNKRVTNFDLKSDLEPI